MKNLIDILEKTTIPFIERDIPKLQKITEKQLDEYLSFYKIADYLQQIPFLWSVSNKKLSKKISDDYEDGIKLFSFFITLINTETFKKSEISNLFTGLNVSNTKILEDFLVKRMTEEFTKKYQLLLDSDTLLNKTDLNILKMDLDMNIRIGDDQKIPILTVKMPGNLQKSFDLTKNDIQILNTLFTHYLDECEEKIL